MLSEDLRVKLAADLPRDVVRRLPSGSGADYVPSHYVIERLNAVCGHDGWSVDYGAPSIREGARLVVHVATTLTVFGGVRRSDVGVGIAANDKPDAIETAIKAAYTDGLKRCARTLGPSFGLALYDKDRRRVGVSTVTLAMLDEVGACDDLAAWWSSAKGRYEQLAADEKDVVKGAVAARRCELAALAAEAQPAVVTQPAPQQLPPPAASTPAPTAPAPSQSAANDPPAAPANDGASPARVAPARAVLEDRLARARSAESIIAAVLAAPLSDEDRAAVRPAIAAAAQRCGITSDALRSRLDAARKVAATPAQWGVAAEILLDLEAAGDVATLDAMRARHAPRATGLPAELVSAVKRRSAEIRNALGAPGPSADAMIAEVNAATTVDGLRSVQARLRAAAERGTITQADAQRVTDALNDRGEALAMREAS